MKLFKNNRKLIALILCGFAFRLILSFFGTVQLDQSSFIAWGNSLVNEGYKSFYNSWSDYLPGYLYFLWALAKFAPSVIIPESVLYKLPAIISDLATGILIYKILSKSKGEKWGIVGAALYVFNPAIFANSALWGQVDSLTSFFSLFAIYLFPINYWLSAISLSIGTLIKPQAAFIFPVIVYLFILNRKKFSEFVLYCLTGLSVFVLAFVPFWNHLNIIQFILERLNVSLNQYQYTSINAFNFWGLLGMWRPDTIFTQWGGYLLVLSIIIITFIIVIRRDNKNYKPEYLLTALIFASSFVFFTRMHERHLLPVFAPLVIAAVENPILLIPYLGFSVTYIANLYFSYIYIVDNFRSPFSDFVVKFFEIFNIASVVIIFYTIVSNIKTKWLPVSQYVVKFKNSKKNNLNDFKFPEIKISKSRTKLILYFILLFAFFTRIFSLNLPNEMYFDEVYHAFTAKVILSTDVAKAWEWWNTPPDGFAYEWTHPPLAKLGMVLGMLVFGQNSFGYRIPGAILGVGAIFLIYLIAKHIFDDEWVGLLSAGVFSLDGLALVMSRIGMNDSYILFFSLLSLYLYLTSKTSNEKSRNFLSALFFGLAISSKWSAIWAVPIFGIILLSYKKKITWSYIWFFTLPFVIYIASYFDMFITNHGLDIWWGMQQQMWWYHTGLRATHPYTSQWWSWPLLLRPIYLYTSDEVNGMVSRIYAFGNPAVFWFGLTSVISALIIGFMERNKKLGLIVFSYLIFFVPWALSPRIMFLYHYLPSIPFMAIATGYILRRFPKIIPYFLIMSTILFIYFYPHWAGIKIPLWLDTSYYWFEGWR